MRRLLVVVLVLVVAFGVLGYWRGWFSVTNEGKIGVQVEPAKFKEDKEAFSKTFSEKTKTLKDQVAGLLKKAEGLAGDEKVHAQKELAELEKKHERLEKQLKELESTGQDRFESLKQDISKALVEVEHKIDELTKKLDTRKDKKDPG